MRGFFAALLIAGLAAGLSCTRQAATGVSIDSAFRPFIAADTRAIAGVDVEKLKATPLYQRYQSKLHFPLLDERTGLDPQRDVSNLLVAWNGERALFMMRGRFSHASIEQKLTSQGAQRNTYRQYTLLGNDENSLVFFKPALALGGSAATLRAAIDLERSRGGRVPSELQERLGAVPKGDPIWAVSRGGLPFAELPMRSDYESALSNIIGYIENTTVGVGVDTGVHLSAYLTCVSAQGAQRVHDGLRAGIALGRLTTKDNQQDLLRMYDAIQVDRDKETVEVKADWPADLVDSLIQYWPALKNGADASKER